MNEPKISETSWEESEWNPANFEKVVTKYQDRIYHFIYTMMWESHLAQDLTQDTFLGAYKGICEKTEIGRIGPNSERKNLPLPEVRTTTASMSTWLYTIARNKAIDEMRRQKVLKMSSLWHFDDSGEEYEVTNLTSNRPSSDLEYRITLHDELEAAMKKVGQPHLTAFLLHLNGFSYLEICGMTGRTLSNVKTQIYRAKESLRQTLLQQQKSSYRLYPETRLNN